MTFTFILPLLLPPLLAQEPPPTEWTFDPLAAATGWYDSFVKETLPTHVRQFVKAKDWGKEEGLEPVLHHFRWFSAVAETLRGPGDRREHTLVVDREGACALWTGETGDLRRVLDACALRATDEAGLRTLGLLCLRLSDKIVLAPERVEILERTFIHHTHMLTLLSGRVGSYVEDLIFRFDEEGRLTSAEKTGIEDLTVNDRDRLLDEADPWLLLFGFVDEATRQRVEEKQRTKERKPPHHDR